MWGTLLGACQKTGSFIWNNVIKKTPGASIVVARAGSAAFNVFRFVEWITRDPNASKSTGAMIAASFAAFGAAGTNVVTRYYNVNRSEATDHATQPEEDLASVPESWVATSPSSYQQIEHLLRDDEEKGEIRAEHFVDADQETEEDESWTYYIGKQLLELNNFWYLLGSGLSSFVSMGAIVQLISTLLQTSYDGECDENESAWWKIAIVYAFTALQMYSNIKSFSRYTVPLSKEYYHELVTQQPSREDIKLKKLHWGQYGTIFLSAVLESINTFFGTTYLVSTLENGIMCNVARLFGESHVNIPAGYAKAFSVMSGITTFFSTSIMTAGAQQRENLAARDNAPVFGCCEDPIQMSVLINSIQVALGSAVAFATLPVKLAGASAEVAYSPWILAGAVFVALLKLKNNLALDQAGVDRERRYRLQNGFFTPTENDAPAATREHEEDNFYIDPAVRVALLPG